MTYIVVVGSLNMDLVVRAERVPERGETVKGETFQTIPGGKGANQAIAASRMGAEVCMAGAVGADAFGQALKNSLINSGVDGAWVIERQGIPTGTATIVVDRSGDNRIIVVPGANGSLVRNDIDRIEPLIAGAGMLILQFEIPLEIVEYAAQTANRHAVPVMLNPAPARVVPDAFLGRVQYLIVNESEAELLAGCPATDSESGFQAAEVLHAKGIDFVIVTLGKQGALVRGKGVRFHLPAREVAVVDTTAAGDTFLGAFAAACVAGATIEQALEFAVAAGTLAVTRFGAQPSIPDREQVLAFIAKP